jgi:four helix bundle protein
VSIAANVAEGYGRSGRGEYLHFLSNARGSLRETETHLIIANRVGFSESSTHLALMDCADEVGRLLYGLTKSVSRSSARGLPGQ